MHFVYLDELRDDLREIFVEIIQTMRRVDDEDFSLELTKSVVQLECECRACSRFDMLY